MFKITSFRLAVLALCCSLYWGCQTILQDEPCDSGGFGTTTGKWCGFQH